MGNTKAVISDVSKAIKKDAKTKGDKAAKKEAKKTEKMAKDEKECPPEESVTAKTKSPLDGTEDRPRKVNLFFNLQFMATGKNGENNFSETGVPTVDYGSEMSWYASRHGMTKAQVMALPEDQRRQILMNETYYNLDGEAKKDAVDNALLIAKIASLKGSPDTYAVLEKEMSKASFGRKVNFLANFLSHLSYNYDYASIEPGAPDTTVSDEQMMKALDESIRTGNPVPAGVCRHMHMLAVRYAQAMGIKEAFGVAFNTTGSSAHMTMVLTSPDDPKKVVQLNYGGVIEKDGVAGPGALSQNHTIPDTGIRLRVFNGKNEHAINLPSEQGAILNRVSGGEDSDLSPNYKSESQIKQVGVATPYGTLRVFHAETPTGNQTKMMGGAYNIKLSYKDALYAEGGVAGFASERPVDGGTLKSKGVYGQLTTGFQWKFYQAPNVNLAAFSEAHFRGSIYCTSMNDQEECDKSSDGQIDLTSGLMARYRTGPLSHGTSLIFQTQPEINNSYNGSSVSVKVPVVKLSHDTNFKIVSGVDGNVGGSVTMYNLGTGTYWTYHGHGAVNAKKTGTYFAVSAEGRLSNDTPFWLPGAEHSASVVINQSIFKDKLYVGVDGKQSFDVLDNRYLGITLGGRF